MEWKDIWKEEPPRNEEIFFMTGDEDIHYGEIFSDEKLRKCGFHSFYCKEDYFCDSNTKYENRVIYWFPIPNQPERSKREDSRCTNCFQIEEAIGRCFSQDGFCLECGRLVRCGALSIVETQ